MNTIKMSFDIKLSVSETQALNLHANEYGYSMTDTVKMLILQFLQRQKEYTKELDDLCNKAFEVRK